MKSLSRSSGFTLVEMAVVLVIVGLMLSGILMPLSTQMEQRDRNITKQRIEEIKEALLGFAVMNGRLPCPTTTADPADANYGIEDASCPAPSPLGYIPWKTLGVAETDAWGTVRTNSGDPWPGYWRYRVDSNFSVPITSISTGFSADALTIQNNSGSSLTTTSERPVAVIISTGKNLNADAENADGNIDGIYQSDVPSSNFDDQLIWLSRPLLINRMVMAGKLP